ncbi:MAG: hypothetical protein CME70_16760 [Halobacteriovorax sp.]|nr:hypothetical protein [Halobacteriovorax sp.]|tara:strand:+ start:176616 stop:177911 length:1296 start_codon:yes stop_codon:yes gene_type:complete
MASPLTEVDKSLEAIFDVNEVVPIKNEAGVLDFNEICHKKLDKYLAGLDETKRAHVATCLKQVSPQVTIENLSAIMNQDQLSRFLAREQIPLFASFLKSCHDKMSEFHGVVQLFTAAAYDISFQNRKMPKSLSTPKGYEVSKFYGNTPMTCYNSGFKAAMYSPKEKSDHVIFAIAGTEATPTYSDGSKRETFTVMRKKGGLFGGDKLVEKTLSAEDIDKEDWSTDNGGATGRNQAATKCAAELVKDAIAQAKKHGKKIIFTGHSLGGALSQGLSYRVTKALKEKGIDKEVQTINFMPAPGYFTVPEAQRDESIRSEVLALNYVSPGDIVSTIQNNFIAKSGPHLGEVRYMERKKEIVDDYLQNGTYIETHSLQPECYGPLGCSEHALGQELSKNYWAYKPSLQKQRQEILEMRKKEELAQAEPEDESKAKN